MMLYALDDTENEIYSPNKTQMSTAVKGADRHDYYRRHGIPLLRIALALLFLALFGFVFLFGLMGWRVK